MDSRNSPGLPEAPIVNCVVIEESSPDPVAAAKKAMKEYQRYVDDLCYRLPGSFSKLNWFLNRGNCGCLAKHNEVQLPKHVWRPFKKSKEQENVAGTLTRACACVETGGNCICQDNENCGCPNDCKTRPLNESVRIYTIDPDKDDWSELLNTRKFETANPGDFEELQRFLFDPEFDPRDDTNEAERQPLDDDPIPTGKCRLITVNHLSPRVAKLLGGKFKISAGFFNSHLPGTEPISGRLIYRLPSSVQIDFDELYESRLEFEELWPGDKDAIELGYHRINQSIRDHFLYKVGWDHFPITEKEWFSSLQNVKMKSASECLMPDGERAKNVFQFSLFHRISIFSEPVSHPRTGQSFTLFWATATKFNSYHHILSSPTHTCPRI
jgi:hypothetical protein